MVLIIFIAEVAAAVVALVYTGLVSGTSESWAGLIWDLSHPLGKQETVGLAVLSVDGEAERWALLQEEGTLAPTWGSHCPKEMRVWYKFHPLLSFKPLSPVSAEA